jgi:hypothetical protein
MRYPKYVELFDAAKEGFAEEVYIWQALYIKRNRDNCKDMLIGIVEKKGTRALIYAYINKFKKTINT